MPATTNRRSSRKCSVPDCTKQSQTRRLCKAHGGGVHCRVPQCPKLAQSQGLCVAHGGGRRCQVTGCGKLAQYKRLCLAHGGGRRCGVANCLKYAQIRGCCKAHAKLLEVAKGSPTSSPTPDKLIQAVDVNGSVTTDLTRFHSPTVSKMDPTTPETAVMFYSRAHEPQEPLCASVSIQDDALPVLVEPYQPQWYALQGSLYRPACRQLYCQRRKEYLS